MNDIQRIIDFIARNPVICDPKALMITFAVLALIAYLGISLIPLYLLHRREYAQAREYFVASEHTPPGVVQNSSIAYSLQVVTFGLFFSWGANGEFWPGIVFSAMFGAGLYLVYRLRRSMLAFISDALDRDRSITVPGFIARQTWQRCAPAIGCGRAECSGFCGLTTSTMIAVASLVEMTLPIGLNATFAIACGLLGMMMLYTIPAEIPGHSVRLRCFLNPVFWIDRIDPDWFVHVDFIGWTNAATWYVRGDRPRGLLRNGADLSTIPIHRH